MNKKAMKIAVPLEGEHVSAHFGHPECFSLITVEPSSRKLLDEERVTPPPHEPGRLPLWLSELGVSVVLAGGMGPRAQDILEARGIEVRIGVQGLTATEAVQHWLGGTLSEDENRCDHSRSCQGESRHD